VKTTPRAAPLLAVLALLAGCGHPLLYSEIEIPDLRVTLPPQAFPAFDAGDPADWCDPTGQASQSCVAAEARYDLGQQVPSISEPGVEYELRLTDVAMKLSAVQSPGAPPDLSGIARAVIRVGHDPLVPGSGTVVATYARPAGAHPATLEVSGNANLDLAPYLSSGVLPIRVEVTVDGGMPGFNADILGAFYLKVQVDWGSYL
jgi:hypothetical protein